MKFSKIIFFLLSFVLTAGVYYAPDALAAEKKSTTEKSSKKSGSSKSSKSSKKDKESSSSKKSKSEKTSKSKKSKDDSSADKSVKSRKGKQKSEESSTKSGSKKRSKKSTASEQKEETKSSKNSSSRKSRNKKADADEQKTSKAQDKQTTSRKKSSRTGKKQDSEAAKSDSKSSRSSKTSRSKNDKQAKAAEPKEGTSRARTRMSSSVGKSENAPVGDKSDNTSTKSDIKKKRNKRSKEESDSLTEVVNQKVLEDLKGKVNTSGLRVKSVKPDTRHERVDVSLNDSFSEIPLTKEFVNNLECTVAHALPGEISGYRVNLNVGKRPLSYYISKVERVSHLSNEPFVTAKEPYVKATKGMDGDIVAMWHSHGRYYRAGSGWQWQRPFLFETAEDVYTMSYILPFVVPMLENAGAYVMLPRERDPNTNEVIVDNDTNPGGMLFSQTTYKEQNGQTKWEQGEKEGFIYDLPDFRDTENPFTGGTYRETKTIRNGKESKAGWYADIPEDGEYAVYVSYKSLPNSTEDALYTVNYSGGSREFLVNQTMGGGTWIYLGTFPFQAGYSDTEPAVVLSNISKKSPGKIVTADAVKIGGGMGNIARSSSRRDVSANPSTPADKGYSEDEETVDAELPQQSGSYKDDGRFSTSGMPRFVEGARYWMHWAGFPESVYSPYHGRDDYKDDYTGRGHWVNYLAGGSRVLPGREGMKIPVDVAMALHSDAGVRSDTGIVGTLGIYYTNGGGKYADGTSRMNSRNLTDIIMRQITGDIRQSYEQNWVRRSMWDKSYLEARVPEVPTTLIELMSHQNYGDMRYGLDPGFRFTVGRAIYKGLGRFMAERKNRTFIAQPLPVQDFAIQRTGKGKYRLSWEPTPDKMESTAMPTKYIIFERTDGNLGFRKIAEVKGKTFDLKVTDHEVHSFKVVAVNDGGLSFDSEVLSLREGSASSDPVLIVNGFTRVSGPANVNEGGRAGFDSREDFGVPYIRDISFTGYQNEFRRSAGNSHGVSDKNYVTKVISGNTFDFVNEHGLSLGEMGYGFVSCSAMAVETGKVKLSNYPAVDLILGKQKTTIVGSGQSGVNFRTFPVQLQQKLREYVNGGGNLLVSGAYVASDLYDSRSTDADKAFAREVLGVAPGESRSHNGRLSSRTGSQNFNFNTTLNDKIYIVERPDELVPENGATTLMKFGDTGAAAAVSHKFGKGRVVTMSVPFETIDNEDKRDALMKDLFKSFNK